MPLKHNIHTICKEHNGVSVVARECASMELKDRVFEVSHSLSRKEAELENAERRYWLLLVAAACCLLLAARQPATAED